MVKDAAFDVSAVRRPRISKTSSEAARSYGANLKKIMDKQGRIHDQKMLLAGAARLIQDDSDKHGTTDLRTYGLTDTYRDAGGIWKQLKT